VRRYEFQISGSLPRRDRRNRILPSGASGAEREPAALTLGAGEVPAAPAFLPLLMVEPVMNRTPATAELKKHTPLAVNCPFEKHQLRGPFGWFESARCGRKITQRV